MLIKLDELREIGRFTSLKHKAPQFAGLNLIFARNGYGKSTVCAVLRSASEDKPEYLSARRKLDAAAGMSVTTSWKGGAVTFNGTKWNARPSKVFVFDQEYIQQNVHVGDSVTRDNKRSLLPVILGEEGVRLARKIVDLDQAQRDTVASLKEQAARIKQNHASISNVASYCSVSIPADIDGKIAAAARAVELARQTVAVKEKAKPKKIETLSVKQFEEVAARALPSVSSSVVSKVQAHLERHRLGSEGGRWIKFGLEHRADTCPFCDQPIEGVDIISAFETYYSQAFSRLGTDTTAAIRSLEQISGGGSGNWRLIVDANTADFLFWQSVTELPTSPSLSADEERTVEGGLKALDMLLRDKSANPLVVVDLAAEPSIVAAFDIIEGYNNAVTACEPQIEAAKQAVQFADLQQAQSQHLKLIALGVRRSEPMLTLASTYAADEKKRDDLASRKADAQRELTTYAPLTMAARQTTINALLSGFGADFRIVDAKANFIGREPNTEFAIAIGKGKVTAGEKSDTDPSFKTVLSAGDKTTLALSFFLTQLRSDPGLKDAVVVFDDPFNSQDMGRQFETTSQIRSISSSGAQVIVLSHDPRFLHMIEKDAPAAASTYQIQCSATGEGAIQLWSSLDELKELYVRNSEIIREYGGHGQLLKNTSEITVLQAIRPFLEDYIRARYPGRFSELKMLDGMTNDIEAAGIADPMFANVADLRALNEYTRPNMHGGGQVPDPTALRAQCKRVTGIIGTY